MNAHDRILKWCRSHSHDERTTRFAPCMRERSQYLIEQGKKKYCVIDAIYFTPQVLAEADTWEEIELILLYDGGEK